MDNTRLQDLMDRIRRGDRRGLAKGISFIENKEEGVEQLMDFAYRNMTDRAVVLGITGPGGAGKSTMVDKVVKELRSQGKQVGVIAVDPSSPYSGGAFLGDRVRMGSHNTDKGVFIRSFGSRGSMGGISHGTKQCLYLYKNFDFDVIIIESLGIGQDETEITNFVDVTVVAVVPGFGDSIQIAKAGMQEIADVFVINKADKPDAEEFYQQMQQAVLMIPEELRPVIMKTVAFDGRGIPELTELLLGEAEKNRPRRDEKMKKRIQMEIEAEVMETVKKMVCRQIDEQCQEVFSGRVTPFEAAREITEGVRTEAEDQEEMAT